MICPACKKPYFFLKKNNTRNCLCRLCLFSGGFVQPSYKTYHDTRYGYEKLRIPNNDPMLKRIGEKLNINKMDVVVDYGCGAGDYTNYFQSKCKDIVGIDINVIRASKRFPNTKFKVQVSKKKIDLKSSSVDKIICVNVIEHVVNYSNLLKEFRRVLKPGGLLFITTFDINFILHNLHYDPTHVIEWDKKEFTALVSKYFGVIDLFSYGSFFKYWPVNNILVKLLKPELCVLACKDKDE